MTIRQTSYLVYDEQPLIETVDKIYEAAPDVAEATTTGVKDPFSDRASRVSWITPDNKLANPILDSLWPIIYDANENSGWDFEISWLEPMQFTKYHVGEKYDWHIDTIVSEENPDDVRKLSFSVLLNDDFEGGEFQVEVGSPSTSERIITVPMKKGDIIVFPSYTWHRVTPVTKGERHSLVGWVHGPNWR